MILHRNEDGTRCGAHSVLAFYVLHRENSKLKSEYVTVFESNFWMHLTARQKASSPERKPTTRFDIKPNKKESL